MTEKKLIRLMNSYGKVRALVDSIIFVRINITVNCNLHEFRKCFNRKLFEPLTCDQLASI